MISKTLKRSLRDIPVRHTNSGRVSQNYTPRCYPHQAQTSNSLFDATGSCCHDLFKHWRRSFATTCQKISKDDDNSMVAVALSGGVDSAVAAYLLSQQYKHNCTSSSSTAQEGGSRLLMGIHMSNWDYREEQEGQADSTTGTNNNMCWEQDWKDAKAVADHLDIPLQHVSFQKEYWNDVFAPYVDQVADHITPNPDVDCNRWIKFGVLKEHLAERYGIERLATGHYARLWDRSSSSEENEIPDCLQASSGSMDPVLKEYLMQPSVRHLPVLLAAKDRSKDQSYFLSTVPATAFTNVLFPLGDYCKKRPEGEATPTTSFASTCSDPSLTIRELAQKAQLPNAFKRESMGICFIGKRKHGDFLNQYIAPSTHHDGSNKDSAKLHCINVEDGTVVATVDSSPSLLYATSGQGAKISGASQKWFVVDKVESMTENSSKSLQLLLCPGTHHPALYSDTLFVDVDKMHWMMGGIPPPLPFRAKCRIRHLQPLVECEIDMTTDDNQSRFVIRLVTPLRGIAKGQICAVYAGGKDGDLICLGGGPIAHRGPSYWDLQQDLPLRLHPAGQNDLSARTTSI